MNKKVCKALEDTFQKMFDDYADKKNATTFKEVYAQLQIAKQLLQDSNVAIKTGWHTEEQYELNCKFINDEYLDADDFDFIQGNL